ncbi:DUF397 domain-containing protein [Streptomyces griseosporeus]
MSGTTGLNWFKSSYSGSQGDDCVEVALEWRKSSYSSGSQGDCVEVALTPVTVHVRDSKDREGGDFAVSAGSWAAFLSHLSEA